MSLFDYSGQTASGATFCGTLEAPDAEEARALLTRMGVFVSSVRPTGRLAHGAPLSLDEFTFFNEQLAALAKAQMPMEEGLRQVAADVGSRKLKRLLLDIASELSAGTALDEALRRHSNRFPAQYATVVQAGLRTGDLAGTLYGLATHMRLKGDMYRTLVELAIYPLTVIVLTMLVMSFVMRMVVPQLAQFMHDLVATEWDIVGRGGAVESLGRPLIVGLAQVWGYVEIGILVLLALAVLAFAWVSRPGRQALRERAIRLLPGFARVYWSSVLARFAHTSALAAFSGAPMPQMLIVSAEAAGSPALSSAARRVADRLSAGVAWPEAAAGEPDMPALWTCAVAVAGPRGDLPAVLAELARAFEVRAQQAALAVRAVLGPLLFLLAAGLIGGLIVSILTALSAIIRVIGSLTG